jgi:hypothetical protein
MELEFDAAKDALNRRRHGVALVFGARVIRFAVTDRLDDRIDYGEERRTAYARIDGHFYACTYTIRGTAYRIISVRRANRREERRYG